MQETLLFSIMWVEFLEAYKYINPETFDEDVAFLKHMSSIDTNGFPRNFGRMSTDGVTGAIHGK